MESFPYEEMTLAELADGMVSGRWSSCELTAAYRERIEAIDRAGPTLRAVIELNPEAEEIAAALDQERASGHVRGPLHGIPILLKDNIATADRMETTAGSLALVGARCRRDATVASRLRTAGAVFLGKTNMSEWANFRSTNSSSGWSGRGGQAVNPYALDRSTSGSSSGSASAVAANLCAAALGTETDGSILSPGTVNGVVGIKPTVGLTSRAGVIPIAHSQDTVGSFGRTVADAAAVLGVLTGVDNLDSATAAGADPAHGDYLPFLRRDDLQGMRIGVVRDLSWGRLLGVDRLGEAALQVLRDLGAEVIDPAPIETVSEIRATQTESEVLLYEFKHDLNRYLADLAESPIRTLTDLITFNRTHADREMPYFAQELLELAENRGTLSDEAYLSALATNHRLARGGIDAALEGDALHALVAPTGGLAWKIDHICGDHYGSSCTQPIAMAGYPGVTVPMGFDHGLPAGICFFGAAWSEPNLLAIAAAYERATQHRRPPSFPSSVD